MDELCPFVVRSENVAFVVKSENGREDEIFSNGPAGACAGSAGSELQPRIAETGANAVGAMKENWTARFGRLFLPTVVERGSYSKTRFRNRRGSSPNARERPQSDT